MSGDQHPCFIDEDRIGEPELEDRSSQLVDLSPGMGPRISRIRLERTDRSIIDRQLASGQCPHVTLAHNAEHSTNIAFCQ